MPRLTVEVSPRLLELLEAGVISITAGFFRSGYEVYGRVNQSHPRLGLEPHNSMTLEDLELLTKKIQTPIEVKPSPMGEALSEPRGTPVKKGHPVKVGTRYDPEIGKVPCTVTIDGVLNSLPKASLCWKDLMHLSDDQLNRRILAVGKEIGADKAVSRIESKHDMATGARATLFQWWCDATNEDRLSLISTAKVLGKVQASETDRLLSRLGAGQYPFRGTDRKIEEDEEEEEESEEELSKSFQQGLVLDWSEDE